MASVYPGALDTFATDKADSTVTATDHPAHHNDLADAVNKIEAELGISPSGSEATVVARLDAISSGDIAFANSTSSGVSIANVSDQTIWTQNVSITAGDILEIETWGRANNGSGGARDFTLTLDADGVFDMEWTWTANAVNQAWRMKAKLVVVATNFAAWELETVHNAQGDGTLQATPARWYGYETNAATDLTGTTAIALKGRTSNATGTPQDIYPYGTVIRKVAG